MTPWLIMALVPMNPEEPKKPKQGPRPTPVYIFKMMGILPNEVEARKAEEALKAGPGLYIAVEGTVYENAETFLTLLKEHDPFQTN